MYQNDRKCKKNIQFLLQTASTMLKGNFAGKKTPMKFIIVSSSTNHAKNVLFNTQQNNSPK